MSREGGDGGWVPRELSACWPLGGGIREIRRALKCSRRLVRQIRDGVHASPDAPKSVVDPLWVSQVDWDRP
jgi:hypothetical protein